MTEIKSKMPKIETLRKYYPETIIGAHAIGDNKLLEIAEFVRMHEGKNHISPDNKILKAIIEWENK